MKNSLLISIIIPVFNSEKFIEETLLSVYNQSYKNYQIIIIDDGSTDGSKKIIYKYLRKGIDKYFFQKNKGVLKLCETINTGLNLAEGELVTMLPSDDYWPTYRLAKQVKCFQDKDVVLVHGKMSIIDENGKFIKYAKKPPLNFYARHNFPVGSIFKYLLEENFISQPTVLIRRETLIEIGGYLQPEGNYAEDYPTHLELAKKGKFIYIDEPTFAFYRQHSNQMTKTHFPEMVLSDNKLILDFYKSLNPQEIKVSKLNLTSVENIVKKRKSIINYMESKRFLLNKDYKNSFIQAKIFLLSNSIYFLKFKLIILLLLGIVGLNELTINRILYKND